MQRGDESLVRGEKHLSSTNQMKVKVKVSVFGFFAIGFGAGDVDAHVQLEVGPCF